MATILRVKRKKDDEPLDALLLSCKRQKVESDAKEDSVPLTAVVKFAGTVHKPEDSVVKHITKILSKDVLRTNYKEHLVDITKKVRDQTKEDSTESRYKIINSIRALDTSGIHDLDDNVINIIDVEDTKVVPEEKKDNSDYVYDLYYTQTKEALELENLVSVLPVDQDLVFEDYYKDEEDGHAGESEDSNSESNWKNDYGDSEHSDNSVKEDDIRKAMKNLNVDDLSSDDSDDFVYGLEEDDVERYGYKYAKYKARMKKEKEEYDHSIDANSDVNDLNDNESEVEEFEKNEVDESYCD